MNKSLLSIFWFGLIIVVAIWKHSINGCKTGKISLSLKNTGVVLDGKNARRFSVFLMIIASLLTLVMIRYFYFMIFDPSQLL
ncbi:MAG: hypothetical protein Q7T59_03270 [Candidatus Woesebacteria bacterium]|nr:hypothetical protein [Candidatus Woesebacteria bacterium]